MPYLFDAQDKKRYRPNGVALYAIGAMFTWKEIDGTAARWVIDGARWFVSAKSGYDAVHKVLTEHGADIAERSCYATVEAPKWGREFDERSVRPKDGSERILFVTPADNLYGLSTPEYGTWQSDFAGEHHVSGQQYQRHEVTIKGVTQTLTFKYVRL
jgi:hypothetical protein